MNIVDELITSMGTYLPDHTVIGRPVRFSDPARTVGVYPVDFTPVEDSKQIGQVEPALHRYLIRIQNMVKVADEVYGKQLFSLDSKSIRVVLYRDTTLHVRLRGLAEELLGTREVVKRWGIGRQRFLNTDLQSQFTFVAQTDFWVESESIEL